MTRSGPPSAPTGQAAGRARAAAPPGGYDARVPSVSTSSSPSPGPRLSRRATLAALAAAGAALAGGCTSEGPRRRTQRSQPTEPTEPQVDPDVAVAAAALAEERTVLALVEATLERHAALATVLAPLVTAHEAHVALLADAVPADVSIAPSVTPGVPSGSPSGTPDETETALQVPRRAAVASAAVARAERDLSISHKQHAFSAQSGAFARVLGSMAGAAAQGATVLHGSGGAR